MIHPNLGNHPGLVERSSSCSVRVHTATHWLGPESESQHGRGRGPGIGLHWFCMGLHWFAMVQWLCLGFALGIVVVALVCIPAIRVAYFPKYMALGLQMIISVTRRPPAAAGRPPPGPGGR